MRAGAVNPSLCSRMSNLGQRTLPVCAGSAPSDCTGGQRLCFDDGGCLSEASFDLFLGIYFRDGGA